MIERARTEVEHLYIFVCTDEERDARLFADSSLLVRPSRQERTSWLAHATALYDNVTVVNLREDNIPSYPNGWQEWANVVQAHFKKLGVTPTHVFTSEPQDCQNYQTYLKLEPVLVDPNREFIHISGTKCRKAIYSNFHFLASFLRRNFQLHLAIGPYLTSWKVKPEIESAIRKHLNCEQLPAKTDEVAGKKTQKTTKSSPKSASKSAPKTAGKTAQKSGPKSTQEPTVKPAAKSAPAGQNHAGESTQQECSHSWVPDLSPEQKQKIQQELKDFLHPPAISGAAAVELLLNQASNSDCQFSLDFSGQAASAPQQVRSIASVLFDPHTLDDRTEHWKGRIQLQVHNFCHKYGFAFNEQVNRRPDNSVAPGTDAQSRFKIYLSDSWFSADSSVQQAAHDLLAPRDKPSLAGEDNQAFLLTEPTSTLPAQATAYPAQATAYPEASARENFSGDSAAFAQTTPGNLQTKATAKLTLTASSTASQQTTQSTQIKNDRVATFKQHLRKRALFKDNFKLPLLENVEHQPYFHCYLPTPGVHTQINIVVTNQAQLELLQLADAHLLGTSLPCLLVEKSDTYQHLPQYLKDNLPKQVSPRWHAQVYLLVDSLDNLEYALLRGLNQYQNFLEQND